MIFRFEHGAQRLVPQLRTRTQFWSTLWQVRRVFQATSSLVSWKRPLRSMHTSIHKSLSPITPLLMETWLLFASQFPTKPVLEFLDEPNLQLTYRELEELVSQAVGYLESLGVGPGDRVALQLSKSLEFIVLHLATLEAGAISLPLNPAFPPEELKYYVQDSASKILFVMENARAKVEPIIQECTELKECVYLRVNSDHLRKLVGSHSRASAHFLAPSDTALLIYTSGTTGRPKGAELTHANLAANLSALHQSWGWREDDVLLHALPLYHLHGLVVALHGALYAGASIKMLRDFDANVVLRYLSNKQCSIFMGVPTMHTRLLAHPEAKQHNFKHLRLITSGSDRLSDEAFQSFKDTFGCTLLERYGMSETSMLTSNPLNGDRKVGSVGLPLPGVRVRIVPEAKNDATPKDSIGEVQVQGPNIFKGYWRQPDKTMKSFTDDGWFRTGDLGYLDQDGYLWLCGRDKDLIISGGANVYPPEVERVLAEHNGIECCAVIGCPDKEWGEKVTAVVVLKEGVVVTPEELIGFCRSKLAPFKSPKKVVFRKDLPRNAMGKVQKAELRKSVCS